MSGGIEQFSASSGNEPEQEQSEQSSAASEPQSQEKTESVRFEDLQQEFQEIEEKLTSEAFDMPAKDRVKLVHRVLEHSLDDGLRFAKKLGISKENLREGMLRPKFAIKHPELIDQLAEYLKNSRNFDYIYDRNKEFVDEFAALSKQVRGEIDDVLASWDYPERLANNIDVRRVQSDKARSLEEDIDDYYTHFLQARSIEEKGIPVDPRTEGVKKAEETLKKAREIFQEQYYPQGVFTVLGNSLGEDMADASVSRRIEFIRDYTPVNRREARRIAHSQQLEKADLETLLTKIRQHKDEDIFDKDDVLEKFEKHRAKPIKQKYEVPKEDAIRTLKKELKQNIIRRGFDEEGVKIYEDKEANEFIVEIEGSEMREVEEEGDFEFSLDDFEKTKIDISKWLNDGYQVDWPHSGDHGVALRKKREDMVHENVEERFLFPDKSISNSFKDIEEVFRKGEDYFLLVQLHTDENLSIDEKPRAIVGKSGQEIFRHNGYIRMEKGKIAGKEDTLVFRYSEADEHILQTLEGEEICRGEDILLKKTGDGIYYKKSSEEGDVIFKPDGSTIEGFENIGDILITNAGIYFETHDLGEGTGWREGRMVKVDQKIHTPHGEVFELGDLRRWNVEETEYGPLLEMQSGRGEDIKLEFITPDGDQVLAKQPGETQGALMTERGLAYVQHVRQQDEDKARVRYPDGNERFVSLDYVGIKEIDGEVVVEAREHDTGQNSLIYEDGSRSDLFEEIAEVKEFERNLLYYGVSGRSELTDDGWDNELYVMVESRDHKIGPFNEIEDISPVKDTFYFVAQKELGGEYAIYNEIGEPVTPSFEELKTYTNFEISDEKILFQGLRDSNFERYKKTITGKQRDVELTQRENKKRKLLNMLVDEDLEEIDEYFKEKAKGKEKGWGESLKDFLSGSDVFAGTVAEAKRKDPQAFLETASAKRDNLSWEKTKEIAYEMFPEIEWKRDETGTGFSSPSSESYLRDRDSMEYRDGDPKAESEEVLTMREEADDLIVSDVLGGYDTNAKRWEKVQFPNEHHLEEPVKENTFTIEDTGRMSAIRLPRSLGAEIIQDRIKGVTEEGQEIRLESTKTPLGDVTAEIPEQVEKIVYSQRKSELPMHMEDMSDDEFGGFRNDFEKQIGDELTESLPGIPEELKLFVQNDLKGLSIKEKVMAIEQKVRELGVYDFDNADVMGAKQGASIADRIRIMRNRADDLQAREEFGQAKYAGVCADFAVLTAGLLREAGIPSGVLNGFRPEGKTVTTKEAHGTAFVVWPHKKGEYKVIPVDGTPGSSVGEEIVDFQKVSLEEQDRGYEEKTEEMVEESKERIEEVEKIIESHDEEKLAGLSNGELEEILNILLEHGVKENHVATLKSVLNASRYSPASIEKLNLEDSEDKEQFQEFIQKEIERTRAEDTSQQPAGAELMSVMQEFIRRYERDYDTEKVFDMLEQAIEAIADNLEDIESKSALTTLKYLRAERMRGEK